MNDQGGVVLLRVSDAVLFISHRSNREMYQIHGLTSADGFLQKAKEFTLS
jgi:hypothetical protein